MAVHSKFVSVGSVVQFAAADAGTIATQSHANVAYGPDGLDLLRDGQDATSTVVTLTGPDEKAPKRQVEIVGQDGSIGGVHRQ